MLPNEEAHKRFKRNQLNQYVLRSLFSNFCFSLSFFCGVSNFFCDFDLSSSVNFVNSILRFRIKDFCTPFCTPVSIACAKSFSPIVFSALLRILHARWMFDLTTGVWSWYFNARNTSFVDFCFFAPHCRKLDRMNNGSLQRLDYYRTTIKYKSSNLKYFEIQKRNYNWKIINCLVRWKQRCLCEIKSRNCTKSLNS